MNARMVRCIGLFAVLWWAGRSLADSTEQPSEQLVVQALRAEMAGDADTRRSLLEQAVATDPDCAAAHWQLGHIRLNDEWMPIDDVERFYRQDERLAAYRAKRDATAGTPSAELALARWCRRNAMPEWGLAHFCRVLNDPGSSVQQKQDAAKSLDLEMYGGVPVAAGDLPRIKEQLRELKKSVTAWHRKVADWREQLQTRGKAPRAQALKELQAIRDVTAIPALESQLSLGSEAGARITVSILVQIDDIAATRSLVRHALFARWPSVVEDAVAELQERPLHDFMPDLLGRLETPIHFISDVSAMSTGHIHRQHAFYREGVFQNNVHLLEVATTPVLQQWNQNVDNVNRYRTSDQSRAFSDVTTTREILEDTREQNFRLQLAKEQLQAQDVERRIARQNIRISAQNARVFHVLESVVAVRLPQTPVSWWNWWQNHNDVYDPYRQNGKPTMASNSYQSRSYSARVGYRTTSTGTQVIGPSCECFVAGTRVWGETGRVAIEDLRIGDRILTQDQDTGEISYQAVVYRSLRPPTDILQVTLDDGLTIASTKGHPYWVIGPGWQMAKELKVGDLLHTIQGPCRVTAIVTRPQRAEAYNLVVAGNGSYFVGDRGVLVHDNTYRAPTTARVPGLCRDVPTSATTKL